MICKNRFSFKISFVRFLFLWKIILNVCNAIFMGIFVSLIEDDLWTCRLEVTFPATHWGVEQFVMTIQSNTFMKGGNQCNPKVRIITRDHSDSFGSAHLSDRPTHSQCSFILNDLPLGNEFTRNGNTLKGIIYGVSTKFYSAENADSTVKAANFIVI